MLRKNKVLRPIWAFKFHIIICLFGLFILSHFAIDPDFGWHQAIGSHFLEGQGILRADIFSWTIPGYIWGNSYFFYQIFIAVVLKYFGFFALVVLFGILGTLAFLVLTKELNLLKAFFVVVAIVLSRANLSVRPHMVSFVFFAVLLLLLEINFFNKKFQPFFYFCFFALWANFHRGFLVGLGVFGLYILLNWLGQKSRDKNDLILPIFCLTGGFLGCFLTPFPFALWHSGVARDFTTFANLDYIQEWQPVGLFFPVNILFAITGVGLALLFVRAKIQPPVWLLISAFLFMLGFVSVNFVFFWCAIFVFIICRYLDFELNFGNLCTKTLASGAVILLLGFVGYYYGSNPLDAASMDKLLIKDKYPLEAVRFMHSQGLTQNVFNEFAWGGFLDWQAPEVKVFIDGRMAAWETTAGRSILSDYVAITRGKCDAFEHYQVKTALLSKKNSRACFGEFNKVWEDGMAEVLVRR